MKPETMMDHTASDLPETPSPNGGAPNGGADPNAAPNSERRRAMRAMAMASRDMLETAWEALESPPAWTWLRRPECGLVMVRGRTGGDGSPFNLGEASVTRCAVTLDDGATGDGVAGGGATGFAWIMGRDGEKARLAALFDALWQMPDRRDLVERTVIAPALEALATADERLAEETAATKVDFFTLARGEDEEL